MEDSSTQKSEKSFGNASDKRPQFGNRILDKSKDVFEHNAWDNVVWDDVQENEATAKVALNSEDKFSEEKREQYEANADAHWNSFYSVHQNRFFKDRHWLFTEFPELAPNLKTTAIPVRVINVENGSNLPKSDRVSEENELKLKSGESKKSSSVTNAESKELANESCLESETNAEGKEHANESCLQSETNAEGKEHANESCLESEKTDERNIRGNPVLSQTDSDKRCNESSHLGSSLVQSSSGDADLVLTAAGMSVHDDFPGSQATYRVLEVGCGAGNTVFPVLETNNDPGLFVYCCDFSSVAVNIVKEHQDYNSSRCHAFVCDVSSDETTFPVPLASLDVIVMIFVLSALEPERMQATISRLASLLKPGGLIVMRDYGRYDMAQLRFKKGQCIDEHFYARGDGTRVYFFTQDDLRRLMTTAGLEEVQNLVDRRLQVNRGKQLKMYRVWVQCKYRKPLLSSTNQR